MCLARIGSYAVAIALLGAVFWNLSVPLPAAAAGRVTTMQAEPEPTPISAPDSASESAAGQADRERMAYLGVMRGYVMPNPMHEMWSYAATGQTADLLEEMERGSLTGGQTGFLPAQFGKFVALEVEQTQQQADVRTIMSPGFQVGAQNISGFYTEAEDSDVLFQPTMFNILARYPEGRVHPYIGLGVGISRSTISFNEETVTNEGFGFAESGTTMAMAFHVLFGFDYEITPHLAVGLGYRHFTVNPVFGWANGSQSEYEVKIHNVVVTTKTYR
jgi:hypothetical protein